MAFASINQASVGGGSSNALAIQSDGIFMPRLSTGQRTALTLTAGDTGLTVYDFTLNNLFIWNGTAWESIPGSGDAGANGSVQYNDNGIVSGATNFVWDKVNGRVGIGTATPAEKLTIDNTLGAGAVGLRVFANDQSIARIAVQNTNGQAYHLVAGNPGVSNAGFALYDNTAAATRYYVDASGNVGIGVTPSAWGTLSKAIEIGNYSAFSGNSSTACAYISNNACLSTNNDTTGWIYKTTDSGATLYKQALGTHRWYNAGAGTAGGNVTFTPAMTLTAAGELLVGLTSGALISSASRLRITTGSGPTIDAQSTNTGNAVVDEWNSGTTGDNIFNRFWTETSGTLRGSISYNRTGGLVAYNVTSDYRSKDIVGPVSNSGSIIDSLKVYVGKMKGATIERPMLIAHEAQEVAPYAVTGVKNEVDADGKDKYQQMDVSSFVPLLIAEIQSLRTRVQTLETR